MTTPGVSSWPYKEGKVSREDIIEGYQKDTGGKCTFTPGPRCGGPLPGEPRDVKLMIMMINFQSIKVLNRQQSTRINSMTLSLESISLL